MSDRPTSSETPELWNPSHMFDASDPIVTMCTGVLSCTVQRIGDIAFVQGAAVGFGLVGLGLALHENAPMRCDECGSPALWDWHRTWPVFCNETCATTWCRKRIG